jgi:hypothetical protein
MMFMCGLTIFWIDNKIRKLRLSSMKNYIFQKNNKNKFFLIYFDIDG